MGNSALHLMAPAILQMIPTSAPYVEAAPVQLDGASRLETVALPSATDILIEASFSLSAQTKQFMHAYTATNGSDGLRADWGDDAPLIGPQFRAQIVGPNDEFAFSQNPAAINDRINLLIGLTILGDTTARVQMVSQVAGGAWVTDHNVITPAGATTFDTDRGSAIWTFFGRGGSNSRAMQGLCWRSRVWRSNSWPGTFPDLTVAANVERHFVGGITEDPAVAVAAYGTPYHEPLMTQAGCLAGTNIGTAADFTSFGDFDSTN